MSGATIQWRRCEMLESTWNRRRFLKVLGTTAVAASVSSKAFGENAFAVSIVVDPADEVASAKPVQWAVKQLAQALKARGATVTQVGKPQSASDGSMWIMVADAKSFAAQLILRDAKVSVADTAEALGLGFGISRSQKRDLGHPNSFLNVRRRIPHVSLLGWRRELESVGLQWFGPERLPGRRRLHRLYPALAKERGDRGFSVGRCSKCGRGRGH